jgi:hypothetical protein
MDKASVERLRFDRRLQNRLGWVEPADREAFLESLPDVSGKMTTLADEEAESAEGASRSVASSQRPAGSTATPDRPVATAGDFSAPNPFGIGRGESS